ALALLLAGFGGGGPVSAQRPVVAMIGTGNVGGALGPALGAQGYRVVYGTRDPARESVRDLVARTGADASAASQADAAARADVVVLAVPASALEAVAGSLGDVRGKILVDMSSPEKRVAEDGYHELVGDSANAERLQAWLPEARVVRISIPSSWLFTQPMTLGPRPTVPLAGQDPRAKETVARMIFDIGMDPFDAGPLRYARYLDLLGLLATVPFQQGRAEGVAALHLLRSSALPCFMDVREVFEAGDPYDLGELADVPRHGDPIPCAEWPAILGMDEEGG
ncbi:MAG TPA: NAD(P)-binding domain-containing protein, partial [Longimicrobiales bacterium]|nr:NAD(P)-binding domain-containing protein [Longimicrobiales bacterium]